MLNYLNLKRLGKRFKDKICLMNGSANPSQGKSVAAEMHLNLCPCKLEIFPDDEAHVRVQESVRNRDIYLIQSTGQPIAENILEYSVSVKDRGSVFRFQEKDKGYRIKDKGKTK